MLTTLRSNDGDSELALQFDSAATYATDDGFEASVRMRGQHWDGDHTHDLSVTVEGLWLRARDLMNLRNTLTNWLRQPMSHLDAADLDGDYELARLPGQSVLLRFGDRPNAPTGRNPIITITFAAGSLAGEFHFVTDQSCLELFRRELSAALEGTL